MWWDSMFQGRGYGGSFDHQHFDRAAHEVGNCF